MNTDSHPVFIVFEGLDGSGKSTIATLVADRLGAALLTTPSTEVRKYRDDLVASFENNQEAAQLFYLATVFDASRRARELLSAGQSVVVDRHFLSTQAYAAFRGSNLAIDHVEKFVLPAELTVFLDVPRDVRAARLTRRGTSAADLKTLVDGAHEALRNEHLERASLNVIGRFLHIEDPRSTPAQIADRVVEETRRV